MTKLGTRRPSFVAVLVAVTVALVGTALATEFEPTLPTDPSNPAFFDPQINVTPSDNLADGQVVSVDGRHFGTDQTGVLRECTDDLTVCSSDSTPFTTGRNGNFGPFGNPQTTQDPQSVPVNFTVHATFVAEGSGAVINCVPSNCSVEAFSNQVDEIRAACHHLTFGTVDTTPCNLPSSVTTVTTSSTSTSSSSSTSTTSTSTSTTTSTTTPTSTSSTSSSTSTSTSTLPPTSSTSSSTSLPGGL